MIRRATFLTATMATVLGIGLFVVKYKVQDLEDELAMIDQQIVSERQTVHVLKAEWSHLNDPGRLKDLAERYLGMVPLDYQQYMSVGMVGQQLGTPRKPGDEGQLSMANDSRVPEGASLSFAEKMKKALNEGTGR